MCVCYISSQQLSETGREFMSLEKENFMCWEREIKETDTIVWRYSFQLVQILGNL